MRIKSTRRFLNERYVTKKHYDSYPSIYSEYDIVVPNELNEEKWEVFYVYFLTKLINIPASERYGFVLYQASLRSERLGFLNKLNDFIHDNQNSIELVDSQMASDYFNIIDTFKTVDKFNYIDQLKFTLSKLHESRNSSDYIDVIGELHQEGIIITHSEAVRICDFLLNKGFIKYTSHADGVIAKISGEGIIEVDSNFPILSPKKEDISNIDLLTEIIDHVDKSFIDFKVDNLTEIRELREKLDDLRERFKHVHQPSINRLFKMKLSEILAVESIKQTAINPIIEDTIKLLQ